MAVEPRGVVPMPSLEGTNYQETDTISSINDEESGSSVAKQLFPVANENAEETATRRMSLREAFKDGFSLSNLMFFAILMTFLSVIDSHKNSFVLFDNLAGHILFCIAVLIVVTAGGVFLYGLIVVIGRHYWPHRFKPEGTTAAL